MPLTPEPAPHGRRLPAARRAAWLGLLLCATQALAAPYKPQSDAQTLETLPKRVADARWRELREMRQALAAQPGDAELAAKLARRYVAEAVAQGDPRYVGYAQAALAPWWAQAEPPASVRVARATVLQYGHQFDAARADLLGVLQAQPDHGDAWAWLAAISLVRADYAQARQACQRLAALATPLIGTACLAQVDALTGQPGSAATNLRKALQRSPAADAEERLWALTRLAEAEERRGELAGAESAYREALALGLTDGYLLAAYADFLLDQGRPAEVLVVLKGYNRSDLLLLRLALAARATGSPEAAAWQAELAARFDAARQRGDALHKKEEARFALAVQGDPARALALAAENFTLQREPSDARILLEAALAAKQGAAAEPALAWMAASGYDDRTLKRLARALKAD